MGLRRPAIEASCVATWNGSTSGLGAGAAQAETEAELEVQVLKVCLEEVRRSRPFLIALIGDRYGRVPPHDRAKAAAEEAGIAGDIAGRSVTDLEIDFGVYQDPDRRRGSLFFLREPLPYNTMGADTAASFSDAHADADPDAAAGAKWLAGARSRHIGVLHERLSNAPQPRAARGRRDR